MIQIAQLKRANGDEIEATLNVELIKVKNYLAYISCLIENTSDQVPAQAFRLSYIYQDREYKDLNYYWIDEQPEINPNADVYHIDVNKSLRLYFRVNLFGGVLLDDNSLSKVIKLRIYNVTDVETLIWESSDIKLISTAINTPSIVTVSTYKNGVMTINHEFSWYSDQDFNYYDDDFHIVTQMLDALGNVKFTDTRLISQKNEVIVFNNVPVGKYVLTSKLSAFTGYTIKLTAEIKQLTDAKPKIFVIHQGKYYESKGIFVKIGDNNGVAVLTEAESLTVKDIEDKPSV